MDLTNMGVDKMEGLKKIRIDRGMTQFEVARKVGVSLNAYLRWEAGVNKPNAENEKKLKEVLKIK